MLLLFTPSIWCSRQAQSDLKLACILFISGLIPMRSAHSTQPTAAPYLLRTISPIPSLSLEGFPHLFGGHRPFNFLRLFREYDEDVRHCCAATFCASAHRVERAPPLGRLRCAASRAPA
eukprot:6177498-Pleurochrysis_carterae.AAC.3